MTQPATLEVTKPRNQNAFGKAATAVDGFFAKYFYKIGFFVGSRPFSSIGISLLFILALCAGFSQVYSETRGDKLWIPQGTEAQDDQATFDKYFPRMSRMEDILLEAKSNSILDKPALISAMTLFNDLEDIKVASDNLATLCVSKPDNGHPCFITSILSSWNFNAATLSADPDPLATLNAQGKSEEDFKRMLGNPTFVNGKLTGAKAMSIKFFLKDTADPTKGVSDQDTPESDWEEKFLEMLKCDKPKCDDDNVCLCDYTNDKFTVVAQAFRSRSDVFGNQIRGDIGLINGAFLIMIVYLILNLGGLCHKIKMRALLSVGCLLTIVLAAGSGYGLAMWFQFDYTPVMSIMPFVLLGIGVDDSFVIMNSIDRTNPSLPVEERIATAISHAGVSIMVTSLTDFVAFAISASSALPALASFCMYAAMSILMLFIFQVTVFGAFATLNARRENAGLIDCCPCVCKKGCPCCPTTDPEEAKNAEGNDPNQLCCAPNPHKGGRPGAFLENVLAPVLVKLPVALTLIFICLAFCGVCAWRTSELGVEDAMRKFIPDDSYVNTFMSKTDLYFGTLGSSINIVTTEGDYFAAQDALVSIGSRIDKLSFMKPSSDESFMSWAASYQAALKVGASAVGTTVANVNGIATDPTQYYLGLETWLNGAGRAFARDVMWVDANDAQKGIRAARVHAEIKSFNTLDDDKLVIDTDKAIQVMDDLRDSVKSWPGLPGKAFAYSFEMLSWEVFRIIKKEMFLNVGLCMAAVLVISTIFLAHPAIAFLVLLSVLMTIIGVLGCMEMWGLAIDNVSVIQLVIAVGLSVDYSAHIAHSFMTKSGTRPERVVATLGDVGSAVMNGGISTFLGVMLLAASKSYVFRVLFQTFFLTVVLGLIHGMLLLPAVLSLVGPEGYAGRIEAHEQDAGITVGKRRDTE